MRSGTDKFYQFLWALMGNPMNSHTILGEYTGWIWFQWEALEFIAVSVSEGDKFLIWKCSTTKGVTQLYFFFQIQSFYFVCLKVFMFKHIRD